MIVCDIYNNMPKLIWDDSKIQFLINWWPHFGSGYVAKQISFTPQQVKTKVDKLKLKMLPKEQRLCIECKNAFQQFRRHGFLCSQCFNNRRMILRRNKPKTLQERFREILRTIRHRNKGNYDIDLNYLLKLWEQQNGRCYYSGVQLIVPKYGTSKDMGTRDPYSMSLDRIDSTKGYVKDNVVFCCWAVNAGKNIFSLDVYIDICKKVVETNEKSSL